MSTINTCFGLTDTVVYYGPDDSFASELGELCSELKVSLFRTDIVTDIIAIPSFLAVINPGSICIDDLMDLGSLLAEMDDPSIKVLFTEKCRQPHIPSRNLIRNPDQLDSGFLKFLILRTRARIQHRKAAWERAERRIVRMMHMIRMFDDGSSFSVSDIADEFQASKRTVQRDIGILEMAGYPILRDQYGKYSLLNDFRKYEFFIGGSDKASS